MILRICAANWAFSSPERRHNQNDPAWGTSFGAVAAKARLPAPIMLPIAATVRNRRRVVSTGVFVGGVLSTRSA
jgi:hypothetical protein